MRKTGKKSALAVAVVLSVWGVGFVNSRVEAANFGAGGVSKLFDDTAVTNATMVPSPTGTKPSETLSFHGIEFYVVENVMVSGNNYLTLFAANTMSPYSQYRSDPGYAGDIAESIRQKAYGSSSLYTAMENLYSSTFANDSIIQEITLKENLPAGGNFYGSELTLKNSYGNDLKAHIWAPSKQEIGRWTGNDTQRSSSDRWWLRSPDYSVGGQAFYVYDNGFVGFDVVTINMKLRPALQILNQISNVFSSKIVIPTNGIFAADTDSGTAINYKMNSAADSPIFTTSSGVILDGTKIAISLTDSTTTGYVATGLLTKEIDLNKNDTWEHLNGEFGTATSTEGISYMAQVSDNKLDFQNVDIGTDYTLKIFGLKTADNTVTQLADNAITGLSMGNDGKLHMKIGDVYNNGIAVTLKDDGVVDVIGDANNNIVVGGGNSGIINLNTYVYSGTISNDGTLTFVGSNGNLSGIYNGTGTVNIGNGDATSDKITSNVTIGVVNIAADGTLETNADKLGGEILNAGNLNLIGGTLVQMVSGTGNITFCENVSANANKIATTGANTISVGKNLTLTDGTLGQTISGDGNIIVSGTVISNALIAVKNLTVDGAGELSVAPDNLQIDSADINNIGTLKLTSAGTLDENIDGSGTLVLEAGIGVVEFTGIHIDNKVEIKTGAILDPSADVFGDDVTVNGILELDGGTLSVNTSGSGTTNFNNIVTVVNGVNLGSVNNVNGTLNVLEHITAGDITFRSGSTLRVDGNKIQSMAAITGITSVVIESGAKLYVSNAVKDTQYKILVGSGINVSSWTDDSSMGNGFQASYGLIVDTDNTTVAGTGLSEFHIQFKEDPNAIEDSDIGTIIKGLPMDSEPKQWIEKISVNQNNTVEKGNTINTMVNMGNLANVQSGSFMMSNYIVDEVFNNIGVVRRNIVRTEKAKILNTECTPNNSYEEQKYGKEVWASFIHSKTKIEGMKTGHLEQDSTLQYNGTVVGVDLWSGRHGFGGVALTYGDGNFHSSQQVSNVKNDADYYGINVYNRQDVGRFSFQYDAGFTYAKNDVTMSTAGADDVTAKPKVRVYSAGIKVEEPLKIGRAAEVVPFAGARYTFVKTKEYQNSLGLGYDVDNQHLVKIPVGMSLRTKYLDKSGWKLGTTLSGGYSWNLCNRSSRQRVSFGGYSDMIDFDIADRGEYFVNAAVQAEYENLLFELGYNYSKGKTTRNNKWYFNANLGF